MSRIFSTMVMTMTVTAALSACKTFDQSADSSVKSLAGSGVQEWRTVPAQAEINSLISSINNPQNPFSDYRPDAPHANFELPGKSILQAMIDSKPFAGNTSSCLNTAYAPTHWSDLQIHYYCTVGVPRYCYTASIAPVQSPSGTGLALSRPEGFKNCMELNDGFVQALKNNSGFLTDASIPKFREWISTTKSAELFQYIMFAQTYAFNPEQEQAIINAYYDVTNPADPQECLSKRPQRSEDPTDGTHCLATKVWSTPLEGVGR